MNPPTRFDFQSGSFQAQDLVNELHLYWYYPEVECVNSSINLEKVPQQSPLDHNYRHHLVVNIISHSILLEEAQSDHKWHPKSHQARVGFDKCLEISVPWSDLNTYPDTPLRMIAVLADYGIFKESLLENNLITLKMP